MATHLKDGVLWVSIAEASINYCIIVLFWRLERRKTSLHTASGTSCTVCLHGGSCYLFLLENFAVEAFLGGFLIAMYIPYETVVPRKVLFFPQICGSTRNVPRCAKGIFLTSFASPLSSPSISVCLLFFPFSYLCFRFALSHSSSVSACPFRDLSISSARGHSSSDCTRIAKCVKPGSHYTHQRFSTDIHSTLNGWKKLLIREAMVF